MKRLTILFDLINWPDSGGHPYDWRYRTLKALGVALAARGHRVFCNPLKGVNKRKPPFPKARRAPDIYICRATTPQTAFLFRQSEDTRFLCYDHGWLPKSLVTDRQGLFGSSYYRTRIGEMLDRYDVDVARVNAYRLRLIEKNHTKRPQPGKTPAVPADYVFIPGQTPYDASITHSSQTGFFEFLTRVVDWAAARDLPVVYKPHPGLIPGFKPHALPELQGVVQSLARRYARFHSVEGAIYDLMQRARFTACINSGSIVDNLTTLTPVYCCGTSFFSDSCAVHYDPDIERGLDTMLSLGWPAERQDRQRRLLWWLRENLVQEALSPAENLARMGRHLGRSLD